MLVRGCLKEGQDIFHILGGGNEYGSSRLWEVFVPPHLEHFHSQAALPFVSPCLELIGFNSSWVHQLQQSDLTVPGTSS